MPWYALKTRREFQLEFQLQGEVDTTFFPKEMRTAINGRRQIRPIIPGIVFVMADRRKILDLERRSRDNLDSLTPFWIYRYHGQNEPAEISPRDINLVRLLTANDATRCEVYAKTDYEKGMKVRVTGGPFQGQEGYVQRVKKNRHVVVRIEGLCAILLPFIHPDLLQRIN
ncbi:MAG: hypothetical protein K2M31_07100 [Muribaculaceae bacterium]|nr:hypothetical protein [Muribaculaceae bacterium]